MNIAEAVAISIQSLRANKLRSFLTLLGLIIGVMTLILVMTIVQGANVYVEEKIANLGTNVFQVSKRPLVVTDFQELIKSQRNKDLLLEDLDAVKAQCRDCLLAGAQVSTTSTVKFGNESGTDTSIRGVTANMSEIGTIEIETGRYITSFEEKDGTPVCIVGADLVENLFPHLNPIGKNLWINGQEYRMVGIAEKMGSVLGQTQDNFVIMPITAFFKQFGSRRSITLNIKTRNSDLLAPAQDQVRMILRGRRQLSYHQPDNFYIATSDTFLSLWASISSAFFTVFILISSIASVVGGIVIMNIMLVTVTERTKEIGIRRAVGARRQDILGQFIIEALVQCIVGGIIGILLGFLAALAVRQFTPFPASVQLWVALTGFFMSLIIGLFFGIYPARKASSLDPIEALRRE